MFFKSKPFGWFLLGLLTISMALFLSHYFMPGMPFGVPNIITGQQSIILRAHIGGGIVAALAGISQFWPNFRMKNPKFHKISGYLYILGIFLSSPAGVIMAFNSQGGLVAHFGFALLSIFWGITTYFAIMNIIKKNITAHRIWMLRSFSLTFAFVTLRLWLGVLMGFGFEFDQAYQTVAWLCWVPNLIAIEWYINRRYLMAKPSLI